MTGEHKTCFIDTDPETTDMLRTCLGGCPDDMEFEVHPGVPLVAKTVADFRALNAWSPYWVLIIPKEGFFQLRGTAARVCMAYSFLPDRYHHRRLPQPPPQPPPRRPRRSPTTSRSKTAPMAALMIAETMPVPRWMPI